MKLSLIMATVGRSVDVGLMIDSLANQTDRNFELIIVDQNQDDRLTPFIEQGIAQGLDIRRERLFPPSLSTARNLGISVARHEILAFPDDDCWYEPEAVERVRKRFDSTPKIAGLIACWVEQTEGLGSKAATGQLELDAWRQFKGGVASSISLFFLRDIFDRLGGFDQQLGLGGWYGAAEETDFVLSALTSGAQLAYEPGIRIHHHFETTAPKDWFSLRRSIRTKARGTGAIYAKHKLSYRVILRGFLAPIVKPWIPPKNIGSFVLGYYVALGRIEGFLRWRFSEQ